MSGGMANLAIGGGDPRLSITEDTKYAALGGEGFISPTSAQMRNIHDSSVTYEEYAYYAQRCRAEEESSRAEEPSVGRIRGLMAMLWPSKNNKGIGLEKVENEEYTEGETSGFKRLTAKLRFQNTAPPPSEKPPSYREETGDPSKQRFGADQYNIADEEWINAQRALRTASGAACFYLITTDILGPFGLPYAIASTGWGPGITLFTIFAVLAGYSGYMLNDMFRGMDSYQYPTRSYGDTAFKVYGQWARIPINFLQSIQLLLSVAIISISNGQALSIITRFNFCYVGCIAVLVAAGMVIGQIRTLQKFGWLANVAVFFNVFIIIFTMVIVAVSPPNFHGSGLSAGAALGVPTGRDPKTHILAPIATSGGLPVTGNFIGALNGIMNAVYAYGGANVFNEFMAEMRRPKDFLYAMWASQFFIWFVYILYGCFLYGYQGQYSINPSPQTISPPWALDVANIMYILSAGIAAALYGNIGLKVFYNNVLVEIFRAPPLTHKTGKILWVILIPVYWAVAFVIGASIPNFGALVGVVGAICIVQFTYSLPPFLYIGYRVKVNATLPGEGFDPATGQVTRHDGGIKRFVRGLTGGSMLDKAMMGWNIIYFLGALALGGLGAYASIEVIIEAFGAGHATTFTCQSPLDGTLLG